MSTERKSWVGLEEEAVSLAEEVSLVEEAALEAEGVVSLAADVHLAALVEAAAAEGVRQAAQEEACLEEAPRAAAPLRIAHL